MRSIDIDAIERRTKAATPGPWAYEIIPWDHAERELPPSQWTGLYIGPLDDETGRVGGTFIEGNVVDEPAEANCDLIAHAREDIPALIAALRERDKRIAELEDALEPFAKEAARYDKHGFRGEPFNDERPVGAGLTIGDLRRARGALEKTDG